MTPQEEVDQPTEFDLVADEICNRLADNLEAIDRKHGLSNDYSILRVPTVELRRERVRTQIEKNERLLALMP